LERGRRQARIQLERYHPNRGKGFAVRTGFLTAVGERVLVCDADLSTPIEDLEVLEDALGGGADIAIGSRALPGSRLLARQPRYRELGGRCLNWGIQALALWGIHDSQCGFKLFRREPARPCFERQQLCGFSYDVEVLFLARRLGLSIAELPVRWRHVPSTKVRPFRDGAGILADLIRIRWAASRGFYDRQPEVPA
jgi:dolichyl-phosphate beta-glucosyltransferase